MEEGRNEFLGPGYPDTIRVAAVARPLYSARIRWPPTSTQMKIFAVFTEPAAGSTSRKCVAGCCCEAGEPAEKRTAYPIPTLGPRPRAASFGNKVCLYLFPPLALFFFNPLSRTNFSDELIKYMK